MACSKIKVNHPLTGEPIHCPKPVEFTIEGDGMTLDSCRSHVGHFVIQFESCRVERKA